MTRFPYVTFNAAPLPKLDVPPIETRGSRTLVQGGHSTVIVEAAEAISAAYWLGHGEPTDAYDFPADWLIVG
jgi:hypothetical protein